jgi:hypothetical protein
MGSPVPSTRASRWSPGGALLVIGLLSSLAAWWLIAWPVVTFANADKHAGHFGLTYLHAAGGTVMLMLGLANAYTGSSRRFFEWHRLIGRLYLGGGAIGAISAVAITTGPAHKAAGAGVFTNATVSLVALALAWLLAAGMGYRAVRNQRYDSHRAWMLRSYVLVWSFVFCRLASRVPGVSDLGGGEAFIWLSWVGPLVLCEVALQWSAGSRPARRPVLPPTNRPTGPR